MPFRVEFESDRKPSKNRAGSAPSGWFFEEQRCFRQDEFVPTFVPTFDLRFVSEGGTIYLALLYLSC